MDNRFHEMRHWISEALRVIAKGKEFTDDMIDKGFNLTENDITLFVPFGQIFISHANFNEIKDLYEYQGKKIQAIKQLHLITKMGLMDAKKTVEDNRNFQQIKKSHPIY